MASRHTWIVKVRMSHPVTGPELFTDDDVKEMLRLLRDEAKSDWLRQLNNAFLENGAVIGSFLTSTETSTQPALNDECQELSDFATQRLRAARRPSKFVCEQIIPVGPQTKVTLSP